MQYSFIFRQGAVDHFVTIVMQPAGRCVCLPFLMQQSCHETVLTVMFGEALKMYSIFLEAQYNVSSDAHY